MIKTEDKRDGAVIFSKYTRGDGIKKALSMSREDVLLEIRESKLKGRGGAGFPTATKWMLTAAAKSDIKYLVCNADEGEPGTFKDRVLLMEYPDLVFDGMVIAGYTIGAKLGIVYLSSEYEYMLSSLEDYLEEMKQDNLLGENILGKGFNFDIQIRLGSGAYVCGEETALIESLEGHRGEVTSISVQPNGEFTASSSVDGTIRIWETATGLCAATMSPPGPYEGMDITGATGLNPAQAAALQALGAVSEVEPRSI